MLNGYYRQISYKKNFNTNLKIINIAQSFNDYFTKYEILNDNLVKNM